MMERATESQSMTSPPFLVGVALECLRRGVWFDFRGVSHLIPLPFFPQTLGHLILLVAWPRAMSQASTGWRVIVRDRKSPDDVNYVEIANRPIEECTGFTRAPDQTPFVAIDPSPQHLDTSLSIQGCAPIFVPEPSPFMLIPIPCPSLLCVEPTEFDVSYLACDREQYMGTFAVKYSQPAPLSEQEIATLLSNPGRTGGVSMVLKCTKCGDHLTVYHTIRPNSETCEQDGVALSTAPDIWNCRCGRAFPLQYLKGGIHEILRHHPMGNFQRLDTIVPYERTALDAVYQKYVQLLNADAPEEDYQRFLLENPIFWAFLGPDQIFKKPPILASFKTDFGVLANNRILWLIEIEKPSTSICRADGGMHSELQAALNQVMEWRTKIEDNRRAILDELKIPERMVHQVRFLIVAGLARKVKSEQLRTIKQNIKDDIQFMTFDELGARVERLIASVTTARIGRIVPADATVTAVL